MRQGIVTEIQRGSLHDGPGIRTVVFLKGCNMRCKWCHNPETVYPEPEILLQPDKCIGCGMCEQGCYSGARKACGKIITPKEVLEVLLEDKPYYGSMGGLTISGGEPMLQPEFTKELLVLAKREGIHTAVETNASLSEKTVAEITSLCDLVMCDMKMMSDNLHRQYTGVGNEAVLRNLARIDRLGIPIIVRTPVIKGVNDSDEEIGGIASFLAGFENLSSYELLSYHPLGHGKPVSEHFTPELYEKPERERMKRLALLAGNYGLTVKIDGVLANHN